MHWQQLISRSLHYFRTCLNSVNQLQLNPDTKDDQLFINDQISRLLSEGVIEPSISPWRAQVVVVKDPLDRHKKIHCIDYSQTVNQYTELDAYPLPRIEDMVHNLAKYKVFSTFDLQSAYHQISIRVRGSILLLREQENCISFAGFHLVSLME